ncbi:uroporphyrinogen-III synthase [Plutella xylostella]|uniref:uroporphyrinogen-III synthase n=1 Tax=Plutella xylostella TaxID=51655 RepID=UPI002032D447|nr:uroporphyrinogen-III synthase [Plutella xylostella]
MKRVVLFKSESEEYARAFSSQQFEAVFVEPLQFQYVGGAALAERLQREYSGLVLTSPRAAEALARSWAGGGAGGAARWAPRRVYVVGEATRRAALQLGLAPRGDAAGSADNLATIIVEENPPGSTFLFPCGNLRSETIIETLTAKGMTVDALTVYETMENENLRTHLMELNKSESSPCCMVFFSPSGCEYIYRQLQTFNNRLSALPHFAIGNSTAHRIVNLGADIAGVALKPKPECMVESVHKYFQELEAQC